MSRDDDLNRVAELIGYLHPSQRDIVTAALDENRDGVLSIAERIAGSELDSPVGAFMNQLKRGQHKRKTKRDAKRTTPRDAFRRLYAAKLRYLEEHDWGDHDQRVVEAIDYAVGYVDRCSITPYQPGETVLTLEAELYAELGRHRA